MEKRASQMKLSLSGSWTDEERAELTALFSEIGPVEFVSSAGKRRGSGALAALTFVSGSIFSGFLSKLGEAMYEKVRTRIKRILSSSGPASFHIVQDKISERRGVHYVCEFGNEKDLGLFFSNIGQLHNFLTLHALVRPKQAHGTVGMLSAYFRTTRDDQRFTKMRLDAYLRSGKTNKPLPTPPYWIISADCGRETYLAILLSGLLPAKRLVWRRWR